MNASASRRGSMLIWGIVVLMALIGFASLAVDFGRVQLAKMELNQCVEAAARAGAGGLAVSVDQARRDAIKLLETNRILGQTLVASSFDVQIGLWDASTRTFRAALATEQANAVRVTAGRTHTAGNPVPTVWAKLIGRDGLSIRSEAIATYTRPIELSHRVDGFANPFLSGMPRGSVASLNNPHNSPDYAGDPTHADYRQRKQSPPVVALDITPGMVLEFDSIEGTVRHDPNLAFYSPDGNLGSIGNNTNGSENGISDTVAPINALVGVFLSDAQPDRTPAPSRTDYSTASSREQSIIHPQLKQIFFIGDGATSAGTKQRFTVPPGATRLYLATWDYYEWNNNWGYRVIRVSRPGSITMVKVN